MIVRSCTLFALIVLLVFPVLADNVQDWSSTWKAETVEYPPQGAFSPSQWPGIGSTILFDADTGTVLQAYRIDEVIPPASMTKLFTMSLVFDHLSAGNISLDEFIKLPPETWSINAPPRSSLMFLGQGQTASWRDLLYGLAVSSGNDAAVAAAVNVSGSLESFVAAMNAKAASLKLSSTSFVEPSGYSEQNTTTARDFARFIFWYIKTYPQALEYHRSPRFTYPRAENLPPGSDPVFGSITQYNKNRLLEAFDGVDGLKTGFIDESGYNLAFTALRNNMRLSGLIMGADSEDKRLALGRHLLDWGFTTYRSVELKAPSPGRRLVFHSAQGYLDLPDQTLRTTLPAALLTGLRVEYDLPGEILGPLKADSIIGRVTWFNNDSPLASLPVRVEHELAAPWLLYDLLDELYLRVRTIWGVPYPRGQ